MSKIKTLFLVFLLNVDKHNKYWTEKIIIYFKTTVTYRLYLKEVDATLKYIAKNNIFETNGRDTGTSNEPVKYNSFMMLDYLMGL